MNDQELLAPLRELEPPPTNADLVTDAVRRGRLVRRRRSRTLAGTAGVVALALAGAGVAVAVSPDAPPRKVGAAPSAAATALRTAGRPPTTAPQRFDPATMWFSLGWRPDRGTYWQLDTSEYRQRIRWLAGDPGAGAAAGGSVAVELFAGGAGWEDPLNDGIGAGLDDRPANREPPHGTTGPTIDGTPSYWLDSGFAGAELAWQWAPGAYAVVAVDRLGGADDRATALRLVRAITVRREAVRLPFRMAAPPKTLPLRAVHAYLSGADYGATVTYSERASMLGPTRAARMVAFQLLADDRRGSNGNHKIPDPNTTIDGHPAWYSTSSFGNESTWLYDVSGNLIKVDTWDAHGTEQLGGAGSTTRYAKRIHPVSDPTDRAGWAAMPH
ncbi:hypothetical protein [Actinocatenispora comari]|uniref:Uncharacterized protein n=1 Tax=Actinocatenispora comari TaxID=2807577 RepID=A0A8J4ACX2_9ACTN|nr:hypothetical protein [Actinocatenispora comari]GIL27372.1 hypothetical protein NUM_26260 [Actinocatenispora comari]